MNKNADLSHIVFFISGVRSGATVCRKMLATHPHVRDVGEIFNSNNGNGYYSYWQKAIVRDPTQIFPENSLDVFSSYLDSLQLKEQLTLVDVKYEHLGLLTGPWQLPFGKPMILSFIEKTSSKVIHLRRQPFYAVLSNLLATQTGRYHVAATASKKVENRISVNRLKVQTAIDARKKLTKFVDHSLPKQRTFLIDYENMFATTGRFDQVTLDAFAQFLAVTNDFNTAPALRKVIDRPLADVVTNFDEIADLQYPKDGV